MADEVSRIPAVLGRDSRRVGHESLEAMCRALVDNHIKICYVKKGGWTHDYYPKQLPCMDIRLSHLTTEVNELSMPNPL